METAVDPMISLSKSRAAGQGMNAPATDRLSLRWSIAAPDTVWVHSRWGGVSVTVDGVAAVLGRAALDALHAQGHSVHAGPEDEVAAAWFALAYRADAAGPSPRPVGVGQTVQVGA